MRATLLKYGPEHMDQGIDCTKIGLDHGPEYIYIIYNYNNYIYNYMIL